MKKIITLIVLLSITLLAVCSCGQTVSQEEYDNAVRELGAAQNQIESLNSRLNEVENLEARNEELKKQNDTITGDFEAIKAQYEELDKEKDRAAGEIEVLTSENEELRSEYDDLNLEYQELSKKYDSIAQETGEETPEILEEDVEQILFGLINQDRVDNGLDELLWGVNIYNIADKHNITMATDGTMEEPEQRSYQEVLWVTGYSTSQEIAEAVFTIWKNEARYKIEFLNSTVVYGTVAVYKSGDIYYITYISDIFR